MKKLMIILVPLLVLSMILTGCADKEPANRLEAIQDSGKIVVGTSADYEPWEFMDADNNFAGIDMELMLEIGDRMGVEVEFQDLGFDNLIAAVKTGKIDCIIAAMGATDERKKEVDFSLEYYAGPNAMVTLSSSGISIGDDGLDAADYVIGTQSGTLMQYWVEENLIGPGLMDSDNLMLYERAEQVFLDLQAGRIDIGISDFAPAEEFLSSESGAEIVWSGAMDPNGQAIAIMKGESELKAELDKHIQDILDEGWLDGVLESYGVD